MALFLLLLIPLAIVIWLAARRVPAARCAGRTDPMAAAAFAADDELRAAGHHPDWAYVDAQTVTATCQRCAGVLTLTGTGGGASAVAGLPLADGDRLLSCRGAAR